MLGSVDHGRTRSKALALGLAGVLSLLAACGDERTEAATPASPAERPTPSGLPVPRWVTLKFGEVNARNGPGDEHRTLWVYRAKGLPVQVVAETREWRRVCDSDGQMAWVHRRVTDGRRAAMNTSGEPLALHAKAQAGAAVRAYLAPGALAGLDECEGGWCRLEAPGASGWARADRLWGTAETAGCGAPPRR